jgi:type VI secretion system protein ImpK
MSQFRAANSAPTHDPAHGSGGSSPALPAVNPLREIFADLISYVLLFQTVCAERPPEPGPVRERVEALLAEQDRRVRATGISWDAYRQALFAVLSWVDEIIQTSAWPYRNEWRHLMLSSFQTLNAGKEFFARLEQIAPDARDVKEIYFLCLSLGFEGQYGLTDKPEVLQEYRRRLYQDVAGPAETRTERIFPEAYTTARPVLRARRRVALLWFAIVVLVPAVLFGIYWYLLHRQTVYVLERLDTPVVGAPTPALTLVQRLRARGIQAEQAARGVVITLPNALFEVGRAQLSAEGQRQIDDVAAALHEHAPGLPVLVEGHASREKGTPEEMNQRLSEDRATNVVALLRQAGLRNERVSGRGFGSTSPIASNDTEEGRARNRRVQIIVENVK